MKNNYVLVKELNNSKTTASGIILPQPKYNRLAQVVCSSVENIKPNDIIIKTVGNGVTFLIDGNTYEAIHEEYIFGIVESIQAESI